MHSVSIVARKCVIKLLSPIAHWMPSAGAKCFRLDGGGGGYIKGGTTFSVRQPGYNCDNASPEAPLHTPRCRGLKEEFSIFCYAERFQFLAFRSRSPPLRLLIILAEREDKNRRPSLPPSSPIARRIKEKSPWVQLSASFSDSSARSESSKEPTDDDDGRGGEKGVSGARTDWPIKIDTANRQRRCHGMEFCLEMAGRRADEDRLSVAVVIRD